MIGRLIIGAVTLAATGYAVKEYCETNGCPWDDDAPYEDEKPTQKKSETKQSFKQAKQFHKRKKTLYKEVMTQYGEFLKTNSIEDDTIDPDAKMIKQKFPDELVNDEVASYLDKIVNTMEILTHNLQLAIKSYEGKEEDLRKIKNYAKAIYDLAHTQLFAQSIYGQSFQKDVVLETLVGVMELAVRRDVVFVDLGSEKEDK